MSRAEELKHYAFPAWPASHVDKTGCRLPLTCDAEQARAIIHDLESELELLTERAAFQARIHDLESALAQRDKRIAELELDVRQFHAAFKSARAEVPEWCQHIVRFVHATDQGRWRDVLTKDRLRACGIDVP